MNTLTLHTAAQLRDDPMCAPVMQEIDLANTAGILHNIRDNVIPHVVAITEEQRESLFEAVRNRFAQLNSDCRGIVKSLPSFARHH